MFLRVIPLVGILALTGGCATSNGGLGWSPRPGSPYSASVDLGGNNSFITDLFFSWIRAHGRSGLQVGFEAGTRITHHFTLGLFFAPSFFSDETTVLPSFSATTRLHWMTVGATGRYYFTEVHRGFWAGTQLALLDGSTLKRSFGSSTNSDTSITPTEIIRALRPWVTVGAGYDFLFYHQLRLSPHLWLGVTGLAEFDSNGVRHTHTVILGALGASLGWHF